MTILREVGQVEENRERPGDDMELGQRQSLEERPKRPLRLRIPGPAGPGQLPDLFLQLKALEPGLLPDHLTEQIP